MSPASSNIPGVQHRFIQVNGIKMHIAEQGEGPLVVLAHGWPELWYSWRHVLPALAGAGYQRSPLELRVFTSPARVIAGDPNGTFSPTTSTLIFGASDAVLVDALLIREDVDALGDMIASTGRKLTTIFITHSRGDHFFGSESPYCSWARCSRLRDRRRFPGRARTYSINVARAAAPWTTTKKALVWGGGVYGRTAASIATFQYSPALQKSKIKWADDTLEKWLTDPEKLVPDNGMAFHVESAEERRAIIGYLKQLAAK